MQYVWFKPPDNGIPEKHAPGCIVHIVPGMGQWMLLHVPDGVEPPDGAIPTEVAKRLLEFV